MDITKATLPKHPAFSLTRTIHPVGQGAFYSERLSEEEDKSPVFSVIYDCGGRSDNVKNEIKHLHEHVDILFISHFHADHISGILQLLNQKDIKQVVFPRISPCRFLVDYVRNCINGASDTAGAFMLMILPILSRRGNINHIGSNPSTMVTPVKGCMKFTSTPRTSIWEYIAIYDENDRLEEELLDSLKDILKLPANYQSEYLDSNIYDHIAKSLNTEAVLDIVKEAYARVFTNRHNSYSMLVLSREVKEDNKQLERTEIDCLYTGDAEPIHYVIGNVQKYNPGFIQVPHHGSIHNHDPKLYGGKPTAFISVGEKNRYRHPGLKTIIDLVNYCDKVHIITEGTGASFKKI